MFVEGGTPRLDFESSPLFASYFEGDGTRSLTFRYTVQSGDNNTAGIALPTSINLDGATLQDKAGNDAAHTSLSIPTVMLIYVNTSTPTLVQVTGSTGAYKAADSVELSAVFSEVMEVTSTPRLILSIGDGTEDMTGHANYLRGGGTKTLVFSYQVENGHNDDNGIQVSGIDLNGGALTDTGGNEVESFGDISVLGVKVDTSPPEVINLSDDLIARKSKTWGWSCNNPLCTYRYVINTKAQHTFKVSDSYGSSTTATKAAANGLYYLHVQAKDGAGNESPIKVATAMLDNIPPPLAVGSIGHPLDGVYGTGQELNFTVRWSENVIVRGTPQLNLLIGGNGFTISPATYVAREGEMMELNFRYVIQDADVDSDGIGVGGIDFGGGSIRDVANNNAVISPLSVPNLEGVLVDAKGPTLESFSAALPGSYREDQKVELRATFSESMVVGGDPQLILIIGGSDAMASFARISNSKTLVFSYTVGAGHNDSDGIELKEIDLNNGGVIQDINGNEVEAFNSFSLTDVLVDTTSPSLRGNISPPQDGNHTSGDLEFTVNFDEIVLVEGSPRLLLTVGSREVYANYKSGSEASSLVFSYAVEADHVDNDGITLGHNIQLNNGGIKDVAGNDAQVGPLSIPSLGGVKVNSSSFATRLNATSHTFAPLKVKVIPLGSFGPSDIEGLIRWFDASDKETLFSDVSCTTPWEEGGGPVGCWGDKSGFGHYYRPSQDREIPPLVDILTGQAEQKPGDMFAVLERDGEDVLFSFFDETSDMSDWMEAGPLRYLREVVVYDGPLLEADRLRIKEYLGCKWNFQVFPSSDEEEGCQGGKERP